MKLKNKIIYVSLSLMLISAAIAAAIPKEAAGEEQKKVSAAIPVTIAFLGDSNLWLGGEDCSNPRAWSYWLEEGNNHILKRCFARSGATITNTATTPNDTIGYSEVLADDNTLYSQAMRLCGAVDRQEIREPDIIIVYGGSNDAWFADRRPGIFDKTKGFAETPSENTSLRSSLRHILNILTTKCQGSEIVMVGPPFMTRCERQNISSVTDAMQEVAMAEGIRMIRLDSDSIINPDKEKQRLRLTLDGVHTTPEGAEKIGRIVTSEIRNTSESQ